MRSHPQIEPPIPRETTPTGQHRAMHVRQDLSPPLLALAATRGGLITRGDPQHRLLVELDGVRYHDPRADQLLDERHMALDLHTLRLTWGDCWVTPCEAARRTAHLIGLSEPPKRCSRCR